MEGHHGREAVRVAGLQHAPVVIEDGLRELALGRLDARPRQRKAVHVEAHLGQQRDVISKAVVVIDGIA